MPQGSTTTTCLALNGYLTTQPISLGGIVGQLATGHSSAGVTNSMDLLRFTGVPTTTQATIIDAPYYLQSAFPALDMSADGNTMVIGTSTGFSGVYGKVNIVVRSGSTWSAQQLGITGSGGSTTSGTIEGIGGTVAISADGNTIAFSQPADTNAATVGCVYIWTRSGSTWSQQARLTVSNGVGTVRFGTSVSLTPDGNTLVAGGNGDNSDIGAIWVFTRTGSTWTQQAKLIPTGYIIISGGNLAFGTDVKISSDGTTIVASAPYDNSGVGAAWIFTGSGASWTQQAKLTPTGYQSAQPQLRTLSISGNGSTVAAGAAGDSNGVTNNVGSVFVFTRSGTTWSQQARLQASNWTAYGSGGPNQGSCVSLSADGNILAIGGPNDLIVSPNQVGSLWLWTRTNTSWTNVTKITAPSYASPGGGFAWRTVIQKNGKTLAVGTPGAVGNQSAIGIFV